jgi:uncharacterized RDD family membrane protein YckC
MDPEQYAEAAERLEADYLAGTMSAEEYTRRRRLLHEGTPVDEAGDSSTALPRPVLPGADSVTGAPLASWGRRAGGWFVDVLVFVAAYITVLVLSLGLSDTGAGIAFLGLVFGPTVYAWLMVGTWGQTLGKMAVGIRVLRSQDAGKVSYARALGRAASVWVLGILSLPLLLAYLWPLWDDRNQTLYDKMASTIVVKDA